MDVSTACCSIGASDPRVRAVIDLIESTAQSTGEDVRTSINKQSRADYYFLQVTCTFRIYPR